MRADLTTVLMTPPTTAFTMRTPALSVHVCVYGERGRESVVCVGGSGVYMWGEGEAMCVGGECVWGGGGCEGRGRVYMYVFE